MARNGNAHLKDRQQDRCACQRQHVHGASAMMECALQQSQETFSKTTPGEWEVLHDTHAAYFSSRGHDELTGCLQHMVAMRKKA